ncbi:hypothetical protein HMI54_004745 [Coelomomyces lativittatus]|nr:hypothetical protein HMI54_004745 [Coelomomyces lativittatus]
MNRIFSSLHPGNLRFHRLQTVNSYSPRLFSSTSLFSDASTDRSFMRVERDEPHRRSGTFSSEDPKRKDRWNRDEKQRGTPSSFQNQSYSKFDNYRSRSPSHSNTFNQRNNRKPFNRNSISIGQYTSFKTEIPYTESPEIKFSELQTLSSEMKSALSQSFGYEKCTPVQSAIFSKLPIENDLLVQAKTGTGKTLGFLIPSLEIIKNKTHPFGKEAKVLILSPTRELALQIHAEAKRICKPFRFGAQYLVGGESKLFQVRSLQRDRSDIVVATPGRILDCLESDSSTRNCLKNIDIIIHTFF